MKKIITKTPNFTIEEIMVRKRIKGLNKDYPEKTLSVMITKELKFLGDKEFSAHTIINKNAFFIKASNNINFLKKIGELENISIDSKIRPNAIYNRYIKVYLPDDNYIDFIVYNNLSTASSVIKLLHEIGHANGVENAPDIKLLDILFFQAILDAKTKVLSRPQKENILTKQDDEQGEILVPIPTIPFVKYHKLKAREERKAWTYALQCLKWLKSVGIDLEPNINSQKDLKHIVHECLKSYEDDLKEKIVFDEDYNIYLKGVYTRFNK